MYYTEILENENSSFFINCIWAEVNEKVYKVDDNTVKFTLNKPDATFLSSLGMDFTSIYSAEYAAFKDYWNGKADFDRLIFEIVPDATTRYAELQAGQCDLMDFPNATDIEKMKTAPKVNLLSNPGLNIAYVAFNTEKAPCDNVKVRQALNLAVDKKAIIDVFIKVWAWLRKVHYRQRFGAITQVCQSLSKISKLVTYEWGDYIKRTKAGEVTAGTYGWSGDNGDPDNFLSPLFGSSNIGNSNYARFNSPELDALLDKAIGLSDKGERTKLYEQAQVLLNEQAPWINVAHSINFAPTSKRVQDYKQSPFGYTYLYGTKLVD